eukprot:CAMPEP_0172701462 /NCGR_PEP_ID=MMETSP1074-20121228/31655_1 /TAXON_ID=2916 /ORGANISM="Ceratium fusus, Strain PA161109" /LENGTH=281 /DNA_ID=CAMNT_0013523015 /DNA_START=49 /DNA_END=890 /DNA_ORIENTATION=-
MLPATGQRRARVLTSHVVAATHAGSTGDIARADNSEPGVCLVLGAGAGIGIHVAKRFAKAGLTACLVRRTGNEGLRLATDAIQADGGRAHGYLVDVTQAGAIEDLVEEIEAKVGKIQVAVYNLGAQVGNRTLEETSLKTFELGWRLGCEGLMRLAKAVAPRMASRGGGALLVTSSTAALRGNAGQHSHAAAMGARRNLCQSLHHELSSKGVHICHLVVDAAVDAPDTLGKLLGPEAFQRLRSQAGDSMANPAAVAETFFHVANQHPSAWTFELDLRGSTCT